jgi:hypothetical protein
MFFDPVTVPVGRGRPVALPDGRSDDDGDEDGDEADGDGPSELGDAVMLPPGAGPLPPCPQPARNTKDRALTTSSPNADEA